MKVFLSSTSKDLVLYRKAAHRAIEGLDGYHCVRMEDFGSIGEAPGEVCRTKIGECDLFVCIVGPSYGSRSPTGVSFTELEYNSALLSIGKKHCLVFKTPEDFPTPSNLIEADKERKRQDAFRERVSREFTVTHFSSADEVSYLVAQAIRNHEVKPGNRVPTQERLLTSQVRSVSYRVAVMNESTIVSDEEVTRAVAALQIQIRRDFAPAWGVDAELTFIAKHAEAPPGSWSLVIEDDSRHPGFVCYHTLTEEGLPEVRVGVRDAKVMQWEWTMGASHDLLEMLANPHLNQTIFASADGRKGKLYAREICDPVSSVRLGYQIDGVTVSNFVYPAWFESFREPGSTRFDHRGHVNAPFEVAEGSYVNLCEVSKSSGWRPVFTPEGATKPVSKTKTKNTKTKNTKTKNTKTKRNARTESRA
jgi:hypothetical protein